MVLLGAGDLYDVNSGKRASCSGGNHAGERGGSGEVVGVGRFVCIGLCEGANMSGEASFVWRRVVTNEV